MNNYKSNDTDLRSLLQHGLYDLLVFDFVTFSNRQECCMIFDDICARKVGNIIYVTDKSSTITFC